jgi:hypothetical protein
MRIARQRAGLEPTGDRGLQFWLVIGQMLSPAEVQILAAQERKYNPPGRK